MPLACEEEPGVHVPLKCPARARPKSKSIKDLNIGVKIVPVDFVPFSQDSIGSHLRDGLLRGLNNGKYDPPVDERFELKVVRKTAPGCDLALFSNDTTKADEPLLRQAAQRHTYPVEAQLRRITKRHGRRHWPIQLPSNWCRDTDAQ